MLFVFLLLFLGCYSLRASLSPLDNVSVGLPDCDSVGGGYESLSSCCSLVLGCSCSFLASAAVFLVLFEWFRG